MAGVSPSPRRRRFHPFNGRSSMYEGSSMMSTNYGSVRSTHHARQHSTDVPLGSSLSSPEIEATNQLFNTHNQKVYCSGILLMRTERLADGTYTKRPQSRWDSGWTRVKVRLQGGMLYMWHVREVVWDDNDLWRRKEKPFEKHWIGDTTVEVIGTLTQSASDMSEPIVHSNVFSLNTSGSNLIFLSSSTEKEACMWAGAIRLAAWERSRLEEIYSAHLIKSQLTDFGGEHYPALPWVEGKLEGWASVRLPGDALTRRLWLVLETTGLPPAQQPLPAPTNSFHNQSLQTPQSPSYPRSLRSQRSFSGSLRLKHKLSRVFSKTSLNKEYAAWHESKLTAFEVRGSKVVKLFVMVDVGRAYFVVPRKRPKGKEPSNSASENDEQRAKAIQVEGVMSYHLDSPTNESTRPPESWLLIALEESSIESPASPRLSQYSAMSSYLNASKSMTWLLAIHEAFFLYGRPQGHIWDPRNPKSLLFGYTEGENHDRKDLFFAPEIVETFNALELRPTEFNKILNSLLMNRLDKELMPPPQTVLLLPPLRDDWVML